LWREGEAVLAEHGEAKDLDDGEDDGEDAVDGRQEQAHDEPHHEQHEDLQPPDVDWQQLAFKLFECEKVINEQSHRFDYSY
jgi:hypothetical protein